MGVSGFSPTGLTSSISVTTLTYSEIIFLFKFFNLVCLAPPFNSNTTYRVLNKEKIGIDTNARSRHLCRQTGIPDAFLSGFRLEGLWAWYFPYDIQL